MMAARFAFAYDTGLVNTGLAMKVVSLVVEGLEQAQGAGLFDWLQEEDADIVCLQDTRCSEYGLRDDVYFPKNYSPYFLDDFDNPKRNGVAIYCKKLPKAIITGLGFTDFDGRGLYIQADYHNVSVGSLLVPSGQAGDEAMNTKLKFLALLENQKQTPRLHHLWRLGTDRPTDRCRRGGQSHRSPGVFQYRTSLAAGVVSKWLLRCL
jgi:hypothetical protein